MEAKSILLWRQGLGLPKREVKKIFEHLEGSCPVRVGKSAAPDGAQAKFFHFGITGGKDPLDRPDRIVAGELAKQERPKPRPAIQRPPYVIGIFSVINSPPC